jgi:hypothetical protein
MARQPTVLPHSAQGGHGSTQIESREDKRGRIQKLLTLGEESRRGAEGLRKDAASLPAAFGVTRIMTAN